MGCMEGLETSGPISIGFSNRHPVSPMLCSSQPLKLLSRSSRRKKAYKMLGRRFLSFLKRSPSSSVSSQASSSWEEVTGKPWGRRVVSGVLICLTGGVALSVLDDLAIYHGCSRKIEILMQYNILVARGVKSATWSTRGRASAQAILFSDFPYHYVSKAMEKATKSEAVINALGEPIVRGPWYNASLAVAHKRQSVSCTFPVSGPQGTGIFQLKAVRSGDDAWFSFLRPRDWEILVMEALLHVPGNDEKQQTFRISVSDSLQPPPTSSVCMACTIPRFQPPENIEKK